jgi:hypothetical protein
MLVDKRQSKNTPSHPVTNCSSKPLPMKIKVHIYAAACGPPAK